jgi:hypothetical protein
MGSYRLERATYAGVITETYACAGRARAAEVWVAEAELRLEVLYRTGPDRRGGCANSEIPFGRIVSCGGANSEIHSDFLIRKSNHAICLLKYKSGAPAPCSSSRLPSSDQASSSPTLSSVC